MNIPISMSAFQPDLEEDDRPRAHEHHLHIERDEDQREVEKSDVEPGVNLRLGSRFERPPRRLRAGRGLPA